MAHGNGRRGYPAGGGGEPPAPSTFQRTLAERIPPLPEGRPVLVACSGGGDSVALALLMHRAGFPVELAHLHHGMRPEAEAAADLESVRALAARLGVPFHCARADVPAMAAASGRSPEMAARDARRDFLRRIAAATGACAVATGHTADDQAETVLLRIARGSSPGGLAGIRAAAPDPAGFLWIRPLLGTSRAALRDWLRRRGETWREDATNESDAHLRNRVRHRILPPLEELLNPRVRDALLRLADLAAAEDGALSSLAELAAAHPGAPPKALGWKEWPLAVRRRLALAELREEKRPESFRAVGEKVFQPLEKNFPIIGKNGADFPTIGKIFSNRWKTSEKFFQSLENPSVALWRFAGEDAFGVEAATGFGRSPEAVWLDAGAAGGAPLRLRRWRPGDAMHPRGMVGRKKLSDVFTDLKVPRGLRAEVAVLECGGRIAALPGWRVDAEFAVRGEGAPSLRIVPGAVRD